MPLSCILRAPLARLLVLLIPLVLTGTVIAAESPPPGTTGGPAGTAQEATEAPVITSATTAVGIVGVPFAFQVTATQEPTGFSASGLPSGLSLDGSTGVISGTPTVAGTSNVTLTATNALGMGIGSVTITIAGDAGPPVIAGPTSVTATVGVPFTYQIVASNDPTSYSATSLPTGLVLGTTTGQISGTPSLAGTTVVTIGASNLEGTGTAALTITVTDPSTPPPGTQPQIISSLNASGQVGTPFSYTIQATNAPTSYGASGLPSGLAIDTATGLITGTPLTSAVTNVSISASNAGGTDTRTLRLVIATSGGSLPPGADEPRVKGGSSCGSGSAFSVLLLIAFLAAHTSLLRTASARRSG